VNASSPDISVVLPYRDVEPTLREAIESVLGGSDENLEVLAIDDGSRDASASIAADIARSDPRVRLLATAGAGLVSALTLGVCEARAPLIARMDGDDVSLPGRLASQRARMSDGRLAALGTRVEAFPHVEAGLARYVEWQNALLTPDDHAREVFVEAPLCHPSTMLRRDALLAIGGYRAGDFPEDYDLWLRLALAGEPMAKLDRVGLRWRHRAGRLTFSDARYSVENIRALKAEHLATRLRRELRELVIWGAGPFGKRLARALEPHGVRAARFVDIDPDKIGRRARGAAITAHVDLDPQRHFVVFAVGALGARMLVRAALSELGFVETRDFLCAA
jgi:glycosyltransferase involved in cell wall biosynthesis